MTLVHSRLVVVATFAWTGLGLAAEAQEGAARIVDGFEDAASWHPFAATGVGLNVTAEPGRDGNALRIDYDFTHGSGFVILQKAVGLTLPDVSTGATYEFTFDVRGDGPANDLEFKLLDTRGDGDADASRSDVWWHNRRGFRAPGEWTTLSTRTRHVTFAWGPSGGAATRKVDKIEFAIAAAEGGKGTLWLDNLRFREVAPLPKVLPAPMATASAQDAEHPASAAVDGDLATMWRAGAASPDEAASAWIDIDLGYDAEFGGVEIVQETASRGAFVLEATSDATGDVNWRPLARADRTGRSRVVMWTPDATARRIRVRADARAISIAEVRLIAASEVPTRNALMSYLAKSWGGDKSPWPDMFSGVQRDWTVVGVPIDDHEALMSEQGIVEVDKGRFTLEGLVRVDRPSEAPEATSAQELLRLADGAHTQRLEQGWMPIPSVEGAAGPLTTSVTALATGEAGASTLLVRYRLTNTTDQAVSGLFFLATRPFQVNPPWQDLKATGGVAPTTKVEWIGDGLRMDGRSVYLTPQPDAGALATLAMGEIVSALRGDGSIELCNQGRSLGNEMLEDPDGFASGAMSVRFRVEANAHIDFVATVAMGPDRADVRPRTAEEFSSALEQATARWASQLSEACVDLPGDDVDNAIRSTLSYILVNADGAGIQPGSRCYERSWIRDGSLTSAAMLAFGLTDPAVRFVNWYADYVYPNGKVPCVVDRRGPDPVDEHDSHGQYIFAVMNAYRFTHDAALLERHWPVVERVGTHIRTLRGEQMTDAFKAGAPAIQEPGKAAVPAEAFFGIMPASISHEGYSAKPMHSFWDGFFTLRGLKDASEMALARGDRASADRFVAMAKEFRESHMNAMRTSMRVHGITYVPGCVELGDFDATSTTVALWPGDQLTPDMQDALEATFDQAMKNFRTRRDSGEAWDGMTPYEWRQVGALVRLGRRADAREYFDWLFELRRPHAWNQWPEVVWQDPRRPKFFGDLPHTWCGSDFLNSVRAMLLFERSEALVLFAGVGEVQARGGVRFENMPTYYGHVSASMTTKTVDGHERVVAELSGDAKPRAGLVFTCPFDDDGRPSSKAKAWVDGKPAAVAQDGTVRVFRIPVTVEFQKDE